MDRGNDNNSDKVPISVPDPDSASSSSMLPPGLQQLLSDLGSWAMAELPDLRSEHLGGFFQPQPGQLRTRTQWQVRMQVLTAVGVCRSLKRVVLQDLDVGDEREEEAEALLGGLRSNPVLERLELRGSPGLGTQAACEKLGGILRASRTLQELWLVGVGMEPAGLGVIARAVPGSVLRSLHLSWSGVRNAAGAQSVAHILTSPALREVRIHGLGLDVTEARAIAHAVPTSGMELQMQIQDALDILLPGLAHQLLGRRTTPIKIEVPSTPCAFHQIPAGFPKLTSLSVFLMAVVERLRPRLRPRSKRHRPPPWNETSPDPQFEPDPSSARSSTSCCPSWHPHHTLDKSALDHTSPSLVEIRQATIF